MRTVIVFIAAIYYDPVMRLVHVDSSRADEAWVAMIVIALAFDILQFLISAFKTK